jgi:hypothetical protein
MAFVTAFSLVGTMVDPMENDLVGLKDLLWAVKMASMKDTSTVVDLAAE